MIVSSAISANTRWHWPAAILGPSCAERSWDDRLLVRLLGRHRHQDVTPIDREIARDADRNAETPMAFSLTLNA
jgi:hypothetical protein